MFVGLGRQSGNDYTYGTILSLSLSLSRFSFGRVMGKGELPYARAPSAPPSVAEARSEITRNTKAIFACVAEALMLHL